jgi:hypothetical protein
MRDLGAMEFPSAVEAQLVPALSYDATAVQQCQLELLPS